MTLLMVETRRADERFGALWSAWQREQGRPGAFGRHGAEALFDHFPFLLWEHFPAVTLEAARRIGLAARAHGMASALRDACARGEDETSGAGSARAWLHELARRRLEPLIPPGDPYWRLLADGPEPAVLPAWSRLPHATAAAFAACGGDPEILPPVQESQTHLYAGLVLYRDCVRWKRDFLSGHRSEVVARVLDALGTPAFGPLPGVPVTGALPATPQAEAHPATPQAEALAAAPGAGEREARLTAAARAFHYGGIAESALDAATEHLARSMAAVTDLPPVSWAAMLARLHGEVLGSAPTWPRRAPVTSPRHAATPPAPRAPGPPRVRPT